MNTSTVKGVQPNGTWKPNDGDLLYKYEYLMEDDTIITAFHTTNEPVAQIGEAVEYLVTKQTTRGKSGKVRKPGAPFAPGGGYTPNRQAKDSAVQEMIRKQWAINQAREFLCFTCGDPSQLTLRDVAAGARHFLLMAEDLDAYIEKSKPVDNADDLPF